MNTTAKTACVCELVMCCVLLLACESAPTATPAPAAVPIAEADVQSVPGAAHFRVASEDSEIRVLVYRDGPLQKLGHNHVLQNHDIVGDILLTENPRTFGLHMAVQVASFVVDDPAARSEEGPDFEASVPDAARNATRANLMGIDVLDEMHYPDIAIRSDGFSGPAWAPDVRIALNVRGHTETLEIPVAVDLRDNRLLAIGHVELSLSKLGMTPFSIFGGALSVADRIVVRFRIVAFRLDAA